MLYAILFCLFGILSGVIALSFLDKEKRFGVFSQWAFSLVLGFTLQGFASLLLALITKNLELSAWITLGGSLVMGIIFWKRVFEYINPPPFTFRLPILPKYIFLIGITAVVLLLAYQSMIWVSGFPYGILKGWGDGAYHMDMIRVLAQSNPFTVQHPIIGGTPLTYTFFINFISGLFLRLGSSFGIAWHLPLFVYGVGIVAGLWNIGSTLIKRSVLRISFVLIVLFGGGLGIFLAPLTTHHSPLTTSLWNHITKPAYEYTHLDVRTGGKPSQKELDKNIVWITPAISFFSHQRSFMPAASLLFLFLSGVFVYWGSRMLWKWFLTPGLIPLSHLHTAVAAGIFGFVILFYHSKNLLRGALYVGLGVLIAIPQILFFILNSKAGSSFELWFGWMACTHATNWFACDSNSAGTDTNVLWFWFKNFGAVFAVWITSFLFIKKFSRTPIALCVFISGVLIFVLGNVIKFQPWEFDNNKLLFYWWFASSLIFVFLLEKLIERAPSTMYRIPYKIASVLLSAVLIITSIASGAVDVGARTKLGIVPRINESHFGYYGNDELKIASFIEKNIPPSAIIVTSSQANQFIPMIAGRAVYLGFEGWLWTQGRADAAAERRRDIQVFAQTGDPSILCSKGATHLYLDASFTQEYAGFIKENVVFSHVQEEYRQGSEVLYSFICNEK